MNVYVTQAGFLRGFPSEGLLDNLRKFDNVVIGIANAGTSNDEAKESLRYCADKLEKKLFEMFMDGKRGRSLTVTLRTTSKWFRTTNYLPETVTLEMALDMKTVSYRTGWTTMNWLA